MKDAKGRKTGRPKRDEEVSLFLMYSLYGGPEQSYAWTYDCGLYVNSHTQPPPPSSTIPLPPTRLLMWNFQYDSYVSVSCRFGLLDYYWVPSSAWLMFLMVYCCALSLGSSLFSEVLRTSPLLEGLTHEFSSRRSHAWVLCSTCLYPVIGRRNTTT